MFVNLIETDQVYGHRKDVQPAFTVRSATIDADWRGCSRGMRAGDLLIVTADHGVDPAHPGTDHTREYAPLLAVTGEMLSARASGGRARAARATTARWPMSARRCCAGSPAATRMSSRGRRSRGP